MQAILEEDIAGAILWVCLEGRLLKKLVYDEGLEGFYISSDFFDNFMDWGCSKRLTGHFAATPGFMDAGLRYESLHYALERLSWKIEKMHF